MKELRRVKLTDNQYDRLWEDRRTVDMAGEMLGLAIMKAAEEAARFEHLFWQSVRRTADKQDNEDVKVDWINRELVVMEKSKE